MLLEMFARPSLVSLIYRGASGSSPRRERQNRMTYLPTLFIAFDYTIYDISTMQECFVGAQRSKMC